jgi:formyltetrahydrofolate deformylase
MFPMPRPQKPKRSPSAILLIHCKDQKGLIASVTDFLLRHHGNILDLDEHVDLEKGVFFMRVEWDLKGFTIPRQKIESMFYNSVAKRMGMKADLYFSNAVPRMALFVSKLSHCLYDVLSRWRSGEWDVEIPLIVSNHRELEFVAKQFGIPYHVFPITSQNKKKQEAAELSLLKKNNIDFVVLARYMQILSPTFVRAYPNHIINIHHSFLPAFPGNKPYHSAHDRGVKIVGATSHYVTEKLDTGPIIEQEVVHVTHKDSVKELIRKGCDLEKVVLSRAIWQHLQRKILVFDNRTMNFT